MAINLVVRNYWQVVASFAYGIFHTMEVGIFVKIIAVITIEISTENVLSTKLIIYELRNHWEHYSGQLIAGILCCPFIQLKI